MSEAVEMRLSELQERADEFGRELAAALILAGEEGGRDRGLMREMTAVAAREMRAAVDWLREGGLPVALVADYERACRNGFQAELHGAMRRWEAETGGEARAA